jgi:tetratricopeptide (TPR) repeat protein
MIRRLTITLREWTFTVRTWLNDWLELAAGPIRWFRPRYFLAEVSVSGHELVSLGRTSSRVTVGTVVGFFGFLVALPRIMVGYGRRTAVSSVWWLRTRTRRQLILTALAATVILGGGVGPAAYVAWERHRDGRRAMLWHQYDAYLDAGNVEKVEATLTALQGVSPRDPSIAQRLAMLRAGEAPAGDSKFIRFLMRTHVVNGRTDRAVREAVRLVDLTPGDWEARCLLIEDALRRGDRAAAQEHLAALPSPKETSAPPSPHVALIAANLFQRLGDTSRYDDLIDYVVLNVLPNLRHDDLPAYGADVVVLLIKCYHQALTELDRFPRLTQYWVPVQQACRAVLDAPDTETHSLVALGAAVELQATSILPEFQRRGKVTAEEYKTMTKEVEDRLGEIWDKVLKREPANALGYVGLAYHKARTAGVSEGAAVARRGLLACGNQADLVVTLARLLRDSDPLAALQFLQQVLHDEDMTPRMCEAVADVAQKAGRPDLARDACRRALRQDPSLVWAHFLEGEICLRLGKPNEAAETLKPIRAELAKNPKGCALYVRVLCTCGSFQLAEEFLEQVKAETRPGPVLLEAARAMQATGRLEDAVRWAKQVLDREPNHADALCVVADCTRQLAEKGDRGWDGDRVREALQAYRTVQRQQPNRLDTANNIAWLELKALGRPRDAFESAAPLRAVEDQVGTPADFLETLGAIYLALGRPEDARRMLEQAVATAGPRPSFFIYLALAHHALKQPDRAEYYLNGAYRMPKRNRDLADLVDASRLILGK